MTAPDIIAWRFIAAKARAEALRGELNAVLDAIRLLPADAVHLDASEMKREMAAATAELKAAAVALAGDSGALEACLRIVRSLASTSSENATH